MAAGGTKAALSWSAPFDGGGAITKYQARWKKGATADGDWEDVPESGPETASHAVSGLDAGAQYTFQVRAVNGHGNGAEATVTATLADDGVAPAPATAEVGAGGLLVTLTFDEALDAASIPDPAAFTVSVQGTARTPAAAAVLDQPDALILTLPAPVRPGETVTVSYTGPAEAGTRPLQDGARNAVAAFAGVAAANGLPAAAPDAPENLQADETGAGGAVTLSWRTPWANGSAITKYRLRYVEGTGAGGTWGRHPAERAGRGQRRALHRGGADERNRLHLPGPGRERRGEGEPATLNATPVDRTGPRVVRSYPALGGNLLVLHFNESLNTGSVPPKSAFMVTVGGEALALVGSNLTRINGSYRALEWTLADSIRPGDTVTVTYTPPTGPDAAPLQDAAGNEVAAFTTGAERSPGGGEHAAGGEAGRRRGTWRRRPGRLPVPWC